MANRHVFTAGKSSMGPCVQALREDDGRIAVRYFDYASGAVSTEYAADVAAAQEISARMMNSAGRHGGREWTRTSVA